MNLLKELLSLKEGKQRTAPADANAAVKQIIRLLNNGYSYSEDDSDENVVTLKDDSGSSKTFKREDYEDAQEGSDKEDWGSVGEPS